MAPEKDPVGRTSGPRLSYRCGSKDQFLPMCPRPSEGVDDKSAVRRIARTLWADCTSQQNMPQPEIRSCDGVHTEVALKSKDNIAQKDDRTFILDTGAARLIAPLQVRSERTIGGSGVAFKFGSGQSSFSLGVRKTEVCFGGAHGHAMVTPRSHPAPVSQPV